MCTYAHPHKNVNMQTYMNEHIHVCKTKSCTDAHMLTCRTPTHTKYMYTDTQKQNHAHIHTDACTHTHKNHAHTYIHLYAHTKVHTQNYTCTHTQSHTTRIHLCTQISCDSTYMHMNTLTQAHISTNTHASANTHRCKHTYPHKEYTTHALIQADPYSRTRTIGRVKHTCTCMYARSRTLLRSKIHVHPADAPAHPLIRTPPHRRRCLPAPSARSPQQREPPPGAPCAVAALGRGRKPKARFPSPTRRGRF